MHCNYFSSDGTDRYKTNISHADHFNVNNKHLYGATGTGFADARSGAVLTANNDSAIVVVPHRVPDVVPNYIKKNKHEEISIIGGTGAVSDLIVKNLNKIIK
ncbi:MULTISPECIES: cell wall-binding repeat-containing protein [Oceanobacillus]|uniref:cell wall-binding repeat-containing protein n=1 Tax=Oceanobacillus TaxID=182709 RepID=UPI0012EC81B3